MKQNKLNDIEKQLTPKCEFHASPELMTKIMNSAADDTCAALPEGNVCRWKTVFATVTSVAAAIILFVILIPTGTSAIAAEKIFARAAGFFDSIRSYSVDVEVRTSAGENFTYANPAESFVGHTMNVSSDGRWKLSKGGRVAISDGNNVYMWLPSMNWGWKCDLAGMHGVIYPFDVLLELDGLMHWMENYSAGLKGADCRKREDEKTIKLIIKAPAQGDYSNDYLKYTSIEDCDTRHTYVFSKTDGRLLSATIDAKYLCCYRTILRVNNIDYNVSFDEAAFSIPDNIEWLDKTEGYLTRMEQVLPINVFKGKSAEETVDELARALKEWNEDELALVLHNYPLSIVTDYGYKGCKLVRTGTSFKSGKYSGVFVPCEIEYQDGRKREANLALKNNKRWNIWEIDGGL